MQPQATTPLSDRELLDIITGHIQEVFWVADAKIEVILFISQGYERVFGRTRESLLANPRSFLDAVHAEDRARVLDNLSGQPEGIAFDHEYRIIRPDGSIRWVWDRGIPVWATDGSLRFFVGAALDITRLKAAEADLARTNAVLEMRVEQRTAELAAAQRRLSLAAQAAGVGFYEYNPDTSRIHLDEVLLKRLGRSSAERDSLSPWEFLHPDDRPHVREAMQSLAAGTPSVLIRYRSQHVNGSWRTIESGATFVPGSGGRPGRFVGASRDITESEQTAERLRLSEQYSRAIFDASPNPTVLVDERGCIMRTNPAFLQFVCHDGDGAALQKVYLPDVFVDERAANRLRAALAEARRLAPSAVPTELHLVCPSRGALDMELTL